MTSQPSSRTVSSQRRIHWVIPLVTVAGVYATYYIYQKYVKKNTVCLVELPGPAASDQTGGNFVDMAKAGSLHEYLAELTTQHGPIGAFWWGGTRVAYITSQNVLCDSRNKKFLNKLSDRPPLLFQGFKPLLGADSLTYVNGEEFKQKYNHVFLAAYQKNMASKIGIMVKCSQQIVDDWTANDSCIVDGVQCGFAFSSKSIIFSSFGEHFSDEQLATLVNGYHVTWTEMEKRIIDGVPPDAARTSQFESALLEVKNTLKTIVKQRNHRDGSFIQCLLSRKDLYPTEDAQLSDAITAVVGGTHTTGNGIAWLLYYVARYQDVQSQMFDEIRHHFDTKSCLASNSVQDISDKLKRLAYCKSVITETLRITSLAPWAARVNHKEDMVLNTCGSATQPQVRIPKGMPFIIGQGVALNDANVFPDPTEFKPDRWSRKNTRKSKILQQSQNAIFGGLGGRVCPGYLFFRTEALIFIVTVLSKFTITLDKDSQAQVGIKYGLVSGPTERIKLRMQRRM